MDLSHVKNAHDANELTRAYLDSLLVEARYLDGASPDTRLTLYGKTFETPIMIAAFSHLDNVRENGMALMAQGAKDAGACNWAGMGEESELEGILATGAQTVKIVKPYADRSLVFHRLEHAYRAGALAVGMDIDHSFGPTGQPDRIGDLEMAPVSLEELKAFVKATPLPFVVKGVLSVQDALKCAQAGVSGILLSHHHGILPCAVPPLMALPAIRKAVGDRLDLFVDCSIDSGIDAFKALALGARAVCVGRAILPALERDGAAGVTAFLKQATGELAGMMAKTGCTDLGHIGRGLLWDASRGAPADGRE